MFESIKSLMSGQSSPQTTENDQTTVVLVGHCGPDSFSLKRAASKAAGKARVERANSEADLQRHRHGNALWLVNRKLDGRFTHANGIELIRETARHDDPPVMMLISNYDDAQQQAIEAGAEPGFGKSQVNTDLTKERLQNAISRTRLTESTH